MAVQWYLLITQNIQADDNLKLTEICLDLMVLHRHKEKYCQKAISCSTEES